MYDGYGNRLVSVSKGSPFGFWYFGVGEEEGSTGSDVNGGGSGSDDDDGPAALSGKDRRYGVVGAVGGGTEHSEAVRARSQYGVLDTVIEGGGDDDDDDDDGGVSRRTSRFEPGNSEASRGREVSLI